MLKVAVKDLGACDACWRQSVREGLAALLGMRWDGACILSAGRNRDLGNRLLGSLISFLLLLMGL